ncbi:WYL domain-containing protein [Cloacibacterium normanense]|uniref:WYL domain-containing protein n=1 Tax=Cloacibacterium normanense TaxID=237258 RepID=A0A2S7I4W8_9FLAO|nr:WYL domain-containing protein [Cloacibacterium normanense]PPZ91616.1 WYL domain-containing protein [Cloacibacterium normanense]
MSSNKNALIRYKTIDNCLRNRTKLWTLEDLIDACSDALYEYEGKYDLVSKRTVQLDIQNMRSEKLGYNAPIEVFQKKFYRYSEPDFSIKNIPVNENDIKVMNDAVQILKQFKDFSIFKEMNGVIQKLEDSVYASKQKAIIHLDKNERLKGLEFIDTLYDAILNKNVLKIEYKSFKARETNYYIIHPQLLKEYNNRWFLITWDEMTYLTLALDRVISIEKINAEYIDKNIDGDHFFKEVIGVTVSQRNRPMNVIFWIDKNNAPYVKTKPFHHSQEIIEELEDGTVFKISVQINFELERVILGFGESIKIIQPTKLKRKIIHKLRIAYKNYEE